MIPSIELVNKRDNIFTLLFRIYMFLSSNRLNTIAQVKLNIVKERGRSLEQMRMANPAEDQFQEFYQLLFSYSLKFI